MLCTQLQNLVFFSLSHWQVCKFRTCSIRRGQRCSKLHDTLPEEDMETLEMSFHQAITLGQNQVAKNMEESLITQSKDSKSSTEEPSPVSTSSPWPSVTTLPSRKSEASVVTTYAPKTTIPQNKPDRQHQGELNITHIRSVVNQPSSKNLGKASLLFFFSFLVL